MIMFLMGNTAVGTVTYSWYLNPTAYVNNSPSHFYEHGDTIKMASAPQITVSANDQQEYHYLQLDSAIYDPYWTTQLVSSQTFSARAEPGEAVSVYSALSYPDDADDDYPYYYGEAMTTHFYRPAGGSSDVNAGISHSGMIMWYLD